jgi:hypothetical protein
LNSGGKLSDDDLTTVAIDRSDVGYVRKAGDFILRIAYHEAVHAGQMLQYLRMAGGGRPTVWRALANCFRVARHTAKSAFTRKARIQFHNPTIGF